MSFLKSISNFFSFKKKKHPFPDPGSLVSVITPEYFGDGLVRKWTTQRGWINQKTWEFTSVETNGFNVQFHSKEEFEKAVSGQNIIEHREQKGKTGNTGYGDALPEDSKGTSGYSGTSAPAIELHESPPLIPRKKSLNEFAAKVPKRQTKFVNKPPTSKATSIYVTPEFDHTPNPNKFWRKFKRGKNVYWKKFYNEEIVLT